MGGSRGRQWAHKVVVVVNLVVGDSFGTKSRIDRMCEVVVVSEVPGRLELQASS